MYFDKSVVNDVIAYFKHSLKWKGDKNFLKKKNIKDVNENVSVILQPGGGGKK